MKIRRSDRFIFTLAIIISFAFVFLALFVLITEYKHIDNTYQNEVTNIANIVANNDSITTKLINEDVSINDDIDDLYINVVDVSTILVMDMDRKLYSSPIDGQLGNTYYISDDYNDTANVFSGETFIGYYIISGAKDSMRAFVPIMEGTTQIGVVSVGINNSDIVDLKIEKAISIVLAFSGGLAVSLIAMIWLNRRFKSDLFGFSPSEIALLYSENKSIIEQLNEAIISVDEGYTITTLNEAAQKMFKLTEKNIGNKVYDIFPFCDFKTIMEEDKHVVNKYRKIDDLKLLMNAFPLYQDEKIIGATAIFRSHLEIDTLLDQITGYQQIAIALRSQKHEFQNKLHVVLGLIKMKDYEKAENYIMENVYTTNLASDYYTSRIKDDRILALFVGKEMQSKEFNASLLLTSDSFLTKTHQPINSDDMVLVLGNLIDNSFEAYINKDMEDKRIVVDIFEDEDKIKITVIDQAGGIDPNIVDHMFERGISSKNGESRGTGLSLVSEIVTVYNGEKNVTSSKEETKIEIILMKVSL